MLDMLEKFMAGTEDTSPLTIKPTTTILKPGMSSNPEEVDQTIYSRLSSKYPYVVDVFSLPVKARPSMKAVDSGCLYQRAILYPFQRVEFKGEVWYYHESDTCYGWSQKRIGKMNFIHKATRPSYNISLDVSSINIYEQPRHSENYRTDYEVTQVHPNRKFVDENHQIWLNMRSGGWVQAKYLEKISNKPERLLLLTTHWWRKICLFLNFDEFPKYLLRNILRIALLVDCKTPVYQKEITKEKKNRRTRHEELMRNMAEMGIFTEEDGVKRKNLRKGSKKQEKNVEEVDSDCKIS